MNVGTLFKKDRTPPLSTKIYTLNKSEWGFNVWRVVCIVYGTPVRHSPALSNYDALIGGDLSRSLASQETACLILHVVVKTARWYRRSLSDQFQSPQTRFRPTIRARGVLLLINRKTH